MKSRQRAFLRIAEASFQSSLFRASIFLALFLALLIAITATWNPVGGILLGGAYAIVVLAAGFAISFFSLWCQSGRLEMDRPDRAGETRSSRGSKHTRIGLGVGFPLGILLMIIVPPRVFGFSLVANLLLHCMIPFGLYAVITLLSIMIGRMCRR